MNAENTEAKSIAADEMSPISPQTHGVPAGLKTAATPTEEYKVGHHKPPLFLIAIYTLVVAWAAISWIPFYGY